MLCYARTVVVLAGVSLACLWPHPAKALWQTPPTVGSGLGVHIKGAFVDDQSLARIKATGFRFVRFSLGWGGVERTRGTYDWRDSDALISKVRAAGLKMVIPMLGGNAAYDGVLPAPQPNTDRVQTRPRAPQSPESVQAYARFVAQAVLRYGTADIVWEIWNEPDLARFWPPKPDAQAFSVLAEITCSSVRRVAPSAVMVGPSLARVPDARDNVTPAYFETFLSSGAVKCVDAISVHPYRHGNEEPEAAFGDYASLFGLMGKHKVYLPLLNTEWGYTTTQVTQDEQAAYALRARLTDMIWGVPLSIWYEWRDSRDDPQDPEGHFGLVTFDGADKPAMTQAEKLWPQIQGFSLERQVQGVDPRDVLLLLRDAKGERALVGWSLRRDNQARVSFSCDGETGQSVLSFTPTLLVRGNSVEAVSIQEETKTP